MPTPAPTRTQTGFFEAHVPGLQDEPEGVAVLPESRPGLALLDEELDEGLLASQQFDEVVHEARDHERLIQIADAVHVQAALVEP